jgi:V-type H+-transporting ATPase subunit a
MFLSPGTVNPSEQLFPGQGPFQVFLLLLALVCVPWMLCLKPYVLWREHQKVTQQGYRAVVADGPTTSTSHADHAEEEEEGLAGAEEMDEEHVRDYMMDIGSRFHLHARTP